MLGSESEQEAAAPDVVRASDVAEMQLAPAAEDAPAAAPPGLALVSGLFKLYNLTPSRYVLRLWTFRS